MFARIVYNIYRFVEKQRFKYLNNYYRSQLRHIGENSFFTPKVVFVNPQNISIGNNSYINGGMIYAGQQSSIIIGNDCLISYNVHFRTVSHKHMDVNIPIRLQGEFEKDIVIEDNVWIGYGVQILPGVKIGKNSIIGAGAVVTRSLPSDGVYGGVPARLIKSRIK